MSQTGTFSGNVFNNDADGANDMDPLRVARVAGQADNVGQTITGSNGGVFVVNADGSYTFDAQAAFVALAADETAVTTIDYQITDDQGSTATATILVTVTGANDAPMAANVPLPRQDETDGASVSIATDGAFVDPDGEPLTYRVVGLPDGLMIDAQTGRITGQLASNASQQGPDGNGTYRVTVTATDPSGAAHDESFVLSVANRPVIANDDGGQVAQNDTTSGNVLANDADTGPDNDPLSVVAINGDAEGIATAVAGDNGGLFTIDADGSYIFDTNGAFTGLAAGESASTTVVYQVSDGQGSTTTARLIVEVTGVNDTPSVVADLARQDVTDGETVSIATADAFADADDDTLRYTAEGLPDGLAIDAVTGVIAGRLTSDASQGGPNGDGRYQVAVTATDASGEAVSQTLTVAAANRPVIANDDMVMSAQNGTASGNVLVNDQDTGPDNDPLRVVTVGDMDQPGARVAGDQGGMFTVNADGSYTFDTNGAFDTLAAGQTATTSVTYQVSDGQGSTTSARLSVEVIGINDAPTADGMPIGDQQDLDGNTVSLDTAGTFDDVDDGDTLTYTASALPPGLVIDAATGVISGTLERSASMGAPYRVSVTATDEAGASATTQFVWQVINPAPRAGADANTVDENARLSVNADQGVLANDIDPDDDRLTVDSVGGQANAVGQSVAGSNGGVFVIERDGSYSFDTSGAFDDLAADAARTTQVAYQVRDADGASDTAFLTVTVTGANDAPVINGDGLMSRQDGDGAEVLLDTGAAFVDPDRGDTLTYRVDNLPPGLMFDTATGQITGRLDNDASANAPYQVTVTATDDNGGSLSQSFVWQIDNVVPVAGEDTAQVQAGGATTGNVLDNDIDGAPDNDPLTVVAINNAGDNVAREIAGSNGGTFVVRADGSYSFTAGDDFRSLSAGERLDTAISYRISDGQGGFDTATLSVGVTGVNDAPVVVSPVGDQQGTDGASVRITPAIIDRDNGDVLTYTVDNLPAGLTIDRDTGIISGTLAADASVDAPYRITVTAIDEAGATVNDVFTLNVANPAPDAAGETGRVNEDADLVVAAANGVLANDADPDGDMLTVDQVAGQVDNVGQAVAAANGGLFTIAADGSYRFATNGAFDDLAAGETRATAVTYRVSDGQGGFDTAQLVVTVLGSNDAPVAVADSAATDQNTRLVIEAGRGVLANDRDIDNGDTLRVVAVAGRGDGVAAAVAGSQGGRFILAADGSYVFEPGDDFAALAAGQTLTTSVDYTVSDGQGATADSTVSVTVAGINDVPTARGQLPDQSASDGNQVSINTAGGFADVDRGDTLAYSADGLPPGLMIDADTGIISGQLAPDASDNGPYAVTVTATDEAGTSITQRFSFSVADRASVAADDAASTDQNTVLSVDADNGVLANDQDPDGDGLAVVSVNGDAQALGMGVAGSNGGVFTLNADGSYVFSPGDDFVNLAAGDTATTSVIYSLDGNDAAARLTITVSGVNDAPVVVNTPDDVEATDGSAVTLDTADAFNDPDLGDTLTYAADNLPDNLVIDRDTGLIQGRLAANASDNGPFQVAVTATDAAGRQATAMFTVRVADVPAEPVDDIARTDEDTALVRQPANGVLINDIDSDGDVLAVDRVAGSPDNVGVGVAGSNGGVFVINADGSYRFDPGMDFQALAAGESATTSISYLTDGGADTATLTVVVDGMNDAPTALGLSPMTAHDNQQVTIPTAGGFADLDTNDTLSYQALGLPDGLSIDAETGLITGRVADGAAARGPYDIQITATDPAGASAITRFTLTVINDPAVAVDDAASTSENTAISRAAENGVLANDRDNDTPTLVVGAVAGQADNVGQSVAGSNGGAFIVNADGSYSFEPGDDFDTLAEGATRTTDITYQVGDVDGQTNTATLTVTVMGANDAPRVVTPLNDSQASDGATIAITTAGAFADADNGDRLTFSADGLPPGISIDTDTGRIFGQLAADASLDGPYTITVTATDPAGASVDSSFDLSVANIAPIAADDMARAAAEGAVAGNVLANDRDGAPDADPLRVAAAGGDDDNVGQAIAGDNGGQFVINADGSYAFTAGDDFAYLADGQTAVTRVTYQISDGQGGNASASLAITVTGANDAPVVAAPLGDISANDGAQVTIPTANAFTDPDRGDVLSYRADGLPPGLVIDAQTGLITGRLAADASDNGPYRITVTATDRSGTAVSSVFSLSANDRAALANGDAASTGENVVFVRDAANGVLANDLDPDGDALSVAAVNGQPANVGARIAGDNGGVFIVAADGSYRFEPGTDFDRLAAGDQATTTITYQAAGNGAPGGTATLSITVQGTNDAPQVVAPLVDIDTRDGYTLVIATADAFNDVDTGDRLTYSARNLPDGLAIDAATGIVSGRLGSDASQNAPYDIIVVATDASGVPAEARFTLNAFNVAPQADDDTATTEQNDVLRADADNGVLANDQDGTADFDAIQVSAVGGNADRVGAGVAGDQGGSFVINADGSYVFDPGTDFDALAAGQSATTVVRYTVSDGQGGTAQAMLAVQVTGINDAPTLIEPIADQRASDSQEVFIPVGGTFADVDTDDRLTYSAEGLPDGLTIDAGTGLIAGTLADDASMTNNGSYVVTVTGTDRNGASVTDQFTLGVVARPADAVADQNRTDENTDLSVAAPGVLANDARVAAVAGVAGSAERVGQTVAGSNGGVFVINDDGSYRFSPDADFDNLEIGDTATTSITYQVDDGRGGLAEAMLTITVDGVNDAPTVALAAADQRNDDGDRVVIDTASLFAEVDDNDTLTYSADGLPDGVAIDSATGRITGRLASDASRNGPYTVTLTATDSQDASASQTFIWTVDNLAPVAADDGGAITAGGAPITGDVLANDLDGAPDNDMLRVAQVAGRVDNLGMAVRGSQGGLFTLHADGSYSFDAGQDFKNLAAGQTRGTAIDYVVTDNQGGTDTARLIVTVTGVNDGPVIVTALADTRANDGASVALSTAGAFADPDAGDALAYSADGLPEGLAIDADTGLITGQAASDASVNGPYTVVVTATDGAGQSTSSGFTWAFDNVAPVATDDMARGDDGVRQTGNVLLNDVDSAPDNDVLNVARVGGDADNVGQSVAGDRGGRFTINADGSYVFVPGDDFVDLAAGETRSTQITYQIGDGQGGLDTATVTVTVVGINQGPTTVSPLADITANDGASVAIAAAGAFADADNGDTLTYSAQGLPQGLAIDADTGLITGSLAVDASERAPVQVRVTATDRAGVATTSTFMLTSLNVAPQAVDDMALGEAGITATGNVLANDRDGETDGDRLVVSAINDDAAGVGQDVAGSNGGMFRIAADGSYQFLPGGDFTNLAVGEQAVTQVTYRVADGQGASDTAALIVTVNGVNDAPQVVRDLASTGTGDGQSVTLETATAFVDPDNGDRLSYRADGLPDGLVIDADTGRITGALGSDASVGSPYQIDITATDQSGASATTRFTLTAVNAAPIAVSDSATTGERAGLDVPAAQGVLVNDRDGGLDRDALQIVAVNDDADAIGTPVTGSNGGVFVLRDDGSYTFDPQDAFTGLGAGESATTTLEYRISDGQGGFSSANLVVTIMGANDAPQVIASTASQAADDGSTVAIAAGAAFADPDSVLTFTADGLPDGLMIDAESGLITGRLASDASVRGPYVITVTATDDRGAAVTDRFTLSANNTVPVAAADTARTPADQVLASAPGAGVLANDMDADGDTLVVARVNGEANMPGRSVAGDQGGLFRINADGSYTFDPNGAFDTLAAGQSAITSVSYTVSDGQGGTRESDFTVTVQGINDAPTVMPIDDQNARDREQVAIAAGSAFADIDTGDNLTFTANGLPMGLVIDSATGRITGQLAADASDNGPYTITVSATDRLGATVSTQFALNVADQPSIAADDSATASENATLSRNAADGVLANDIDPDGDGLSVVQVNGQANAVGASVAGTRGGLFTIGSDGGYTFTTNNGFDTLGAGQTATTSVTYSIADDDGGMTTATLTVTVTGTNDAPRAVATIGDTAARVGDPVLLTTADAFADADGNDRLTYTADNLPAGLSIDADTGVIGGTLGAGNDVDGPTTIAVTATDRSGATATTSFDFTVNDTPAQAADDSVTTAENTPVSADADNGVLANDRDADGTPLTVGQVNARADNVGVIVAGSNGGTFVVSADGSYSFDPGTDFDALAPGQTASTSVTYQPLGGDMPATLSVTLTGANDAPTTTGLAPITANVNTPVQVSLADAFNDIDNGDRLSFSADGLPPGLSLDADTGVISGTVGPDAARDMPYQVRVTVTDTAGASVSTAFDYRVVDDPATAIDDTATTDENTVIRRDAANGVLANDRDDDTPNPVVGAVNGRSGNVGMAVAGSQGGTFIVNADGSYSFDPNGAFDYLAADQSATTQITYQVGAGGDGATATLVVTVQGTNDAPTTIGAIDDVAARDGQTLAIGTADVFADADRGDVLLYSADNLPAGLAIDADTGLISGRLAGDASQQGPFIIGVTATDGQGAATTARFTLDITNIAPVAVSDNATTGAQAPATGNVLANDRDGAPDTDALTVIGVGGRADSVGQPLEGSAGGRFTIAANGDYRFEPGNDFASLAAGQSASTQISYQASDGQGGTATTTLVVTVMGADDAPTLITPIADVSANDGTSVQIETAGAFADPDANAVLSYAADGLPEGLTIDADTGRITGQLAANASDNAPYSVTITATDQGGNQVTDTFVIRVNDPASVAVDDRGMTGENTPLTVDAVNGVLANDINPDGDTLSVVAVDGAADRLGQRVAGSQGGTFTLMADGSYRFEPGADFDRLAQGEQAVTSITYRVSGAADGTDTATLSVAVTGVNDAPNVITPLGDQREAESASVTIATAGAFADVDRGDTLRFAAAGLPSGLTIDARTGLITGTLARDAAANGPYTVTVTATDDFGQSIDSRFMLTAYNQPVTAMADTAAASADRTLSVNAASGVLANDRDGDGDRLSVAAVNDRVDAVGQSLVGANGGRFTIAADGSYVFDPNGDFANLAAGQTATTSIRYTTSDGQGSTQDATLSITVTGVNDAPTVVAPLAAIDANNGERVAIPTDGIFRDVDNGDRLSYQADGLPAGLAIDPDTGLISGRLAVDADDRSPYTVVVTATDTGGATITSQVTISVGERPTVAVDDMNRTTEGAALDVAAPGVLANDRDPDGDGRMVVGVAGTGQVGTELAGSNGGTFVINADGSYRFDPGQDFSGLAANQTATTSITYQAANDAGGQDTARLTITVDGQNNAPAIVTPLAPQAARDGDTVAITTAGTFVDSDRDDRLSYSATGLPAGLTIDTDTGRITGRLAADASAGAPYTIVVTASDGQGASAQSQFALSVTNPAPVAVDDTAANTLGADTTGNVLTNDADGAFDDDTLRVDRVGGRADGVDTAVRGSQGGLFTLGPDGNYSFTANGDFDRLAAGATATTSITYRVVDGQGGTDTAKLVVTVTGINDAPDVARDPADRSDADGETIRLATAGNFADADVGDRLTYRADNLPPGLSIDPNTGVIQGRLDADASLDAPYRVSVTATDTAGASATGSFTWQVVNLAPVAVDDRATVTAGDTGAGSVLANDRDGAPDNDDLRVDRVGGRAGDVGQSVAGSNGGRFTVAGDGSWRFDPEDAFTGLAAGQQADTRISYRITDDQGGSATANLVVTVTGVNEAPTVVNRADPAPVFDGDRINLSVSERFADVDQADVLSYAATGLPDGLALDPATGRIAGRLASDASVDGPYIVTLTAIDRQGGQVSTDIRLTVNNRGPMAVDDTVPARADRLAEADVLANDRDGLADTDMLFVDRVAGSPDNVGVAVAGSNGGQFVIASDGSLTFTPAGDFDSLAAGGTASTAVTYEVSDGQGGLATAQAVVTVTGVNDAPRIVQALGDRRVADGNAVVIAAGPAFADADAGDRLTYSATGLPDGLAIDAETGTITGSLGAAASQAGPYQVTVTATDDAGVRASSPFTLTAMNVAPIAEADDASTGENTVASGNVLENDADGGADRDPLTVARVDGRADAVGTAIAGSAGGRFIIGADGQYRFDPGPDFDALAAGETRTTQITYQISDGQGGSDTATLTVVVAGANDAPVVARPTPDQTVSRGQNVVITAGDAFVDAEGGPLSYSADGLPAGLMIDPDTGRITGTIGPDQNAGPYTVTVTARDPGGAAVSDQFTITAPNAAPVAVADAATVDQNTLSSGNVLANDRDAERDTLRVAQVAGRGGSVGRAVAGSAGGRFTIDADGGFVFEPAGAFNDLAAGERATTAVTYQVADGQGGFDTATLTITVTGVDDGPVVADPTPAQSADDGQRVTIAAGNAFASPDGADLTFAADGLPDGLMIDPETGLITGRLGADASVNGPYVVVVTATDANGITAIDRFTLDVANLVPVATQDTARTGENTMAAGNVLANDRDGGNDGDPLRVGAVNGAPGNVGTAIAGSAGGMFLVNADGSYTFDPGTDFDALAPGDTATTSVTYQVSDGQGGTATETLMIVLEGANDAPVIGDQPLAPQSARDGQSIALGLGGAFFDIDGDTLTYAADNLPPGLVIDTETGLITGTVANNASNGGPYRVTITVSDGNGGMASQSFTWTVTNEPPIAGDDTNFTSADNTLTVSADDGVLANDIDPDGDGLVLQSVAGAAENIGQSVAGTRGGRFTIAADGGYRFDPNGDFDDLAVGETATTSVVYTVNDEDGGTAEARVVIQITGVDQAPTVVRPTPDQSVDDGQAIVIAAGDAFADRGTLSFAADGLPDGLKIDAETGVITGALGADASANAPYTIVVTATDANGNTVTDRFVITARNVDPVARPDRGRTDENTATSGNVLDNDRDGRPDNDRLRVDAIEGRAANVGRSVAGSNGGMFVIGADGEYRFDPNGDFDDLAGGQTRTTTVTYQVADGQGGFDTAELTLVVEGALQAGELTDDTVQFGDNYRKDITGAFNDIGLNGPLNYSAAGLPQGLTIDAATGIIRGNPVALGPFTVTIVATDANGRTVTADYGVRVLSPAVLYDNGPSGPVLVAPGGIGLGTLPIGGFVGNGLNELEPDSTADFEFGVATRLPNDLDLDGFGSVFDVNFTTPKIRYQATQTDGSPLPGTLTINADTGEISGRLPADMSQARLTVIAIDDQGDTRTREVWVDAMGQAIAGPGDRALAERPDLYRRSEITLIPGQDATRTRLEEDRGNPMQVVDVRLKARNLFIDIQDPEASSAVEYTARLVDGSALPSWLVFDRDSADLSGRLPMGQDELHVRIVAVDQDGDMRVLDLDVRVDESGQSATQGWRSLSDEANRALSASGDRSADSRGARLTAALKFNN